jgi:nucleoside-diphosphate-sugar epimerase
VNAIKGAGRKSILVTGAVGQIGRELTAALRDKHGDDAVIASSRKTGPPEGMKGRGPFVFVDVRDRAALDALLADHEIDTIYHMATILSVEGEEHRQRCFETNLVGCYNVLEAALTHGVKKVITPSSIAAFGPEAPRDMTPNMTILRPTTIYGVTKVSVELLGNYYFEKTGLDVRGVRLPGIMHTQFEPSGGTTDYSVKMFYDAVRCHRYTCFVGADTVLPFMYLPDAIKALMDLAEADVRKLRHHCDYNVTAFSFSAGELADSIRELMPDFQCDFRPDYRDGIAASWPNSLDDSAAREDWGWKPDYSLEDTVRDMLDRLGTQLR